MVGWHHRFNDQELGQTLGDGEGQGSLACCSPWGRKELDMTERLNNNKYYGCNVKHDDYSKQQKEKESEVAQLCPTLCDPMDCSLSGSSVHGIFQATILEWVAITMVV